MSWPGGARDRAALWAVVAFAVFPLLIRYGRALQPDALMLGAVVLGLACWDRHQAGGRWVWLPVGWLLLATGFALKITGALVLVPLLLAVVRRRRAIEIALACAALLPALAWYVWALHLIADGTGSRAATDNRSIWLGVVGSAALLKLETLRFVGWSLLRGFSPVGVLLAVAGFVWRGQQTARLDRLWWTWAVALFVTLAFLAGKLHHEYYWLLLAPPVAVGVGRMLDRLAGRHFPRAAALWTVFAVLCAIQARSTWQTPAEWTGIEQAARAVATCVPRDAWLVAPEALLFEADRRGCRLEWSRPAALRAAGEWGSGATVLGPQDLLEYYRRRGARYFADLGESGVDPRRKGLHDFVRQRYKVMVDSREVIIADLTGPEVRWNAN